MRQTEPTDPYLHLLYCSSQRSTDLTQEQVETKYRGKRIENTGSTVNSLSGHKHNHVYVCLFTINFTVMSGFCLLWRFYASSWPENQLTRREIHLLVQPFQLQRKKNTSASILSSILCRVVTRCCTARPPATVTL